MASDSCRTRSSTRPMPEPRDRVRALSRGLAILRHVNQQGDASAGEIATALDLPRPTVYRLLRTLEEEGYVVLAATSNRVRVTPQAASLGDGYGQRTRLCGVAGRVFAAHADSVVWPLDLTTYENAAMVIQETTHARSPLSIDRGMSGTHLPMLHTSAGRAYLAFCDDAQRQVIVEHLRRLNQPADRRLLSGRRLEALLAGIRARGIASRHTGRFKPKTSSIALPVRRADGVVACVSLIWVRSAMGLREAIRRYADPLRAIVSDVEALLEEDHDRAVIRPARG